MRMDPTDFADVTGYTSIYLLNRLTAPNWTGLFTSREKVQLRFIAAGAKTYFDVRLPGLSMTVAQADGQNVQPVEVDEVRIGVCETFDMIVQPEDRAYTLFEEAIDLGDLRSQPGGGPSVPRLPQHRSIEEEEPR